VVNPLPHLPACALLQRQNCLEEKWDDYDLMVESAEQQNIHYLCIEKNHHFGMFLPSFSSISRGMGWRQETGYPAVLFSNPVI
jgi:hypothetical protein